MSDLVKDVYLIEENPASIKLAQYNIEFNKLSNINVHHAQLEEKTDDLLKDIGSESGHDVMMVDPPRGGLSPKAIEFLLQKKSAKYLLYLSCNPETLVRDLAQLQNKWSLLKVRPYDFFPKTKHVEVLTVLEAIH